MEVSGAGGGQAEGAAGMEVDAQTAKAVIDALVNMGISENDAKLAARQTGAVSVEAAIAWVFENSDASKVNAFEGQDFYQEHKMVFVVNTSLPMTTGKMAAQVAHGAIDLYEELVAKQEQFGGPLLHWKENGSKKIVLNGNSADELLKLAVDAKRAGLQTSAIYDAGKTQIPMGSHTVLAIFGRSDEVDKVTGHLKLL